MQIMATSPSFLWFHLSSSRPSLRSIDGLNFSVKDSLAESEDPLLKSEMDGTVWSGEGGPKEDRCPGVSPGDKNSSPQGLWKSGNKALPGTYELSKRMNMRKRLSAAFSPPWAWKLLAKSAILIYPLRKICKIQNQQFQIFKWLEAFGRIIFLDNEPAGRVFAPPWAPAKPKG
jgi:hypothetical protein